jgi:type I restriction enzyme R subunit
MLASPLDEAAVEQATQDWFQSLGYSLLFGPSIAPGEPGAERNAWDQSFLASRLRDAIKRLNPNIPRDALDDAYRKVTTTHHPSLIANNRTFHKMLVDGVPVEYQKDGRTVHDQIWLVDWTNPDANDWQVVNQFTVIEGQHNRRPDVVVFVNGLPLAVIELKNAADENANIWAAFRQIQTYKEQIPSLFTHNAVVVISDGVRAILNGCVYKTASPRHSDGSRFTHTQRQETGKARDGSHSGQSDICGLDQNPSVVGAQEGKV